MSLSSHPASVSDSCISPALRNSRLYSTRSVQQRPARRACAKAARRAPNDMEPPSESARVARGRRAGREGRDALPPAGPEAGPGLGIPASVAARCSESRARRRAGGPVRVRAASGSVRHELPTLPSVRLGSPGKSGTRSFSGSFQLSVSRASMSWDLCPTELKPNEFSLPWRPGTRASCCGVCRQRRQSPPGPRRPSNPSESGRPAGVPGRLSGSWRNSSDAGRSRETSAPKLCCVRHFSGFVATYKLGGILHEAIIFGLINTLAAAIKRKCIRARFGARRERPLPRRRGADTRPAARRQRESETAQ